MDLKPKLTFLKKVDTPTSSTLKLNPSQQIVFDNPLPKRQKLQSIDDPKPKPSSISVETKIKDPKAFATKLDPTFAKSLLNNNNQQRVDDNNIIVQEEVEVNNNYQKPSKIYQQINPIVDLQTPTIFQMPPLPCFAQQKMNYTPQQNQLDEMVQYKYDSNGQLITQNYSCLTKQGLWKIGKMKIKRNEVSMVIAGIRMNGRLSNGEGKMAAISGDNYFDLGNWNGMWVVEPSQDLFDQEEPK